MRKHGFTGAGHQRYRCVDCDRTGIRRRPDISGRLWRGRFTEYLTGSERLSALARRWRVSIRTLRRRFAACAEVPAPPSPRVRLDPSRPLVLDATGVHGREIAALIARSLGRSVAWRFAPRECFDAWADLLSGLEGEPLSVVCDGQRGMLKAVRGRFGGIPIQRCVIHVHRQAAIWITRRPKTAAGRELLAIAGALLSAHDRAGAGRWEAVFRSWLERHRDFLKERSASPSDPSRFWYTHRKLRAARSLLLNALPHLFTFLDVPGTPRTTNHLEGGINSRIKDLYRCHRGIPKEKKIALAAWYLHVRDQGENATRFGH